MNYLLAGLIVVGLSMIYYVGVTPGNQLVTAFLGGALIGGPATWLFLEWLNNR